jgi:segregation and condensation protein B
VVGKPFLYCTTREFLMHFGLKSLDDLPPLEEFEETFGEAAPAAALQGGEDREERVEREVLAVEELEAEREPEEAEREVEAELERS